MSFSNPPMAPVNKEQDGNGVSTSAASEVASGLWNSLFIKQNEQARNSETNESGGSASSTGDWKGWLQQKSSELAASTSDLLDKNIADGEGASSANDKPKTWADIKERATNHINLHTTKLSEHTNKFVSDVKSDTDRWHAQAKSTFEETKAKVTANPFTEVQTDVELIRAALESHFGSLEHLDPLSLVSLALKEPNGRLEDRYILGDEVTAIESPVDLVDDAETAALAKEITEKKRRSGVVLLKPGAEDDIDYDIECHVVKVENKSPTVKMLLHYANLAHIAYGDTDEVTALEKVDLYGGLSGRETEDGVMMINQFPRRYKLEAILRSSTKNCPAHILMVIEEQRPSKEKDGEFEWFPVEVLLIVRGTKSLSDIFTDCNFECVDYPRSEKDIKVEASDAKEVVANNGDNEDEATVEKETATGDVASEKKEKVAGDAAVADNDETNGNKSTVQNHLPGEKSECDDTPHVGKAHAGIMESGEQLIMKYGDRLAEFEAQGAQIVTVGHSLGAGASAICAMSLKESGKVKNIRCFAFACPALVDDITAKRNESYITTIINQHDIIARFSGYSLLSLHRIAERISYHEDLLDDLTDVKDTIKETIKDGIARHLSNSNKWFGTGADGGGSAGEASSEANASASPQDNENQEGEGDSSKRPSFAERMANSLDAGFDAEVATRLKAYKDNHAKQLEAEGERELVRVVNAEGGKAVQVGERFVPRLVVPGRVIHLYLGGTDNTEARVAQVPNEAFARIHLSKTCITDHLMGSYLAAIEKVLE